MATTRTSRPTKGQYAMIVFTAILGLIPSVLLFGASIAPFAVGAPKEGAGLIFGIVGFIGLLFMVVGPFMSWEIWSEYLKSGHERFFSDSRAFVQLMIGPCLFWGGLAIVGLVAYKWFFA